MWKQAQEPSPVAMHGVPRGEPTSAMLREVEEQARVDATLDVERRSTYTTFVIVVIAVLYGVAAARSPTVPLVFEWGIAVVAPLAALRLLLAREGRKLEPGSPARLRIVFGPFLVLVATFAAFAAWGCVAAQGTTVGTVILATQLLCSAAVVVSYSGMPRLAGAMIIVMIVPTSVAILAAGGTDHANGYGALLFCIMLLSYLPRFSRERRGALLSMLLLTARARSLEAAHQATLAAAAEREKFFANLSHEIRTPLHGLLGTIERLKSTSLDELQRTAVGQVQRCGYSLLHTLNDALDSTRIESGELQLRLERVTLPALVREVIDLFVDEAAEKGLALTLDVDVTDYVIGDAQRLRQVLQNLVGNAVKFTERGHVTVRARTTPREGAAVELAVDVVDSGIGFAAEDRARLFLRFSPLSARRGGGSGLGLSISAELVRLMGGTLEGSSAGVQQGASFQVRIPLRTHSGASTTVTGRRVLAVDDNPVNLAVASAFLQALGVCVDVCAGGDEALRRLAEVRYDVILMDCNMPGKDGFATTRELRARGDTTPVLAITATTDSSTAQRCNDAGMEALVEKPISSESLREALARVIERRSA